MLKIGLTGQVEISKGGPGSGPHSKGSFVRTSDGRTGKVLGQMKGKIAIHFPKTNENGQKMELHHPDSLKPSQQKEYMSALMSKY